MVVEQDVQALSAWLPATLQQFGLVMVFFVLIGLAAGYIVMALLHGPLQGGEKLFWSVFGALGDVLRFSPRRIMALAWLAFQESIRSRVLAAFGVFTLLLLFGSWFIDSEASSPAKLFLAVLVPSTYFLTLMVSIFLSVFSIPTDLKQKTIYTVVTKPVRRGEMVLGRILGFSAVGTLLLSVMGLASYFFVKQSLTHSHEVVERKGENIPADERLIVKETRGHKHNVLETKDPTTGEVTYFTDYSNHYHELAGDVVKTGKGTVGSPQGMFSARVPLYGKLSFLDRQGRETNKGINVGNEWDYRSFIEGGSPAAAVWRFPPSGLTADKFPSGLPLELTLRVFRTYKGDLQTTVAGGLVLRNPKTRVRTKQIPFLSREYSLDRKTIPVEQLDESGQKLDLFKDLVDPELGMELILQCLDSAQYFGVAQADVYVNAGESSFELNFLKGYLYIWTQMVIVTALGVMFSTVFNSAVSLLATAFSIVVGYYSTYIFQLQRKEVVGGGPLESLVRIVTQDNMLSPLKPGLQRDIIERVDEVLLNFMQACASLVPDFSQFNRNLRYLADGYNIPGELVVQNLLSLFGYLLPIVIIGYLFMRTREVAK